MSTPDRAAASIHVVTPEAGQGRPAPPPASTEPEAQPPITSGAPEQERTPDLGGQALPQPAPEVLAEAEGGGVADRLKARWQSIAATEEFSVPGWEFPDGRPGLVLVARTYGDRKAWNTEGVTNEVFIAKSTHQLFFVEDDGSRVEIEGGWGPRLAKMIGVDVAKAADLVAMVISKPNPSRPSERIPNVAGIGGLATDIVAWSRRASRDAEESLGE